MNDNSSDNKIAFLAALVSIILAASPATPLKEFLVKTRLDFGFLMPSLLTLTYLSFAILLLSLYLYALDYVRYGFKNLGGVTFFKFIQLAANTLYLIAIISPLAYLLLAVMTFCLKLIPQTLIATVFLPGFMGFIVSLLSGVLATYVARRQIQTSRRAAEESLDELYSSNSPQIKKMIENKLWGAAIVEAFKSFELILNKKLVDFGLDPKRLPFQGAVRFLKEQGLITENEFNELMLMRSLRNTAVHMATELAEEDAKRVVGIVDTVAARLETRTTSGHVFENEVLEALTAINGLFLKHHFQTQAHDRDARLDAIGEGPKYKYLIEIKATQNTGIIKRAAEHLRHIGQEYGGDNIRFLLIVPSTAPQISFASNDTKIGYYNFSAKGFVNRSEIYDWIYKAS